MPGVANNNEKGFWEDLDLVAINIELLEVLDQSWSSIGRISNQAFLQNSIDDLKIRAIRMLNEKTSRSALFGFKDPRTVKLLPFWKDVFDYLSLDVSYIIALRNPLGVAESLRTRDGFDYVRSFYLWLEHIVLSMQESKGFKNVVVDYDLLLEQPIFEIERIAKALSLSVSQDNERLDEFSKVFLDKKLRHSRYSLSDLNSQSNLPCKLFDTYSIMQKLASDDLTTQDNFVGSFFEEIDNSLFNFKHAFDYVDRLCAESLQTKVALSQSNQQVSDLNQHVSDLNQHVSDLNQHVSDLNQHVSDLNQHISDLNNQAFDLNEKFNECKLIQDSLKNQILGLNNTIVSIYDSKLWKITRPYRVVIEFIRDVRKHFY